MCLHETPSLMVLPVDKNPCKLAAICVRANEEKLIQNFANEKHFCCVMGCDTVDDPKELRLAAAGWLGGFGTPPPPLASWLAGAPPENSQNT